MAGTCTGPGPCDTTSFGNGDNWVNKVGGLPAYIRAVAHAFRRKGLSESEAIQRAVGVVKNWAEGKGGVTAETRARAVAAVAEWEAKKAASHSLTAAPAGTVDLTADVAHTYRHGWVRIDASTPSAVERATRAVGTDGHALLHGAGMVPAAQRVIERAKAIGHPVRVRRVDVAGTPHVHLSRDATNLTAAPGVQVDLAFTEALHPRGAKGSATGGKFVAKNSGSSAPPSNMAANVRDFQRRNGLPVTGVIDKTTAAKITAARTAKSGSGKTAGKAKARKAAAAARRAAKARAKAAKLKITQHVATVNTMTGPQRAAARAAMPVPPTGYVWSPNNQLVRYP